MNERQAPRVTVLISGKGSNLRALLEHQTDYRVTDVISNRADAGGLRYAEEFGITTTVLSRSEFSDLTTYKEAVFAATRATAPDIVALAGFMMILQPDFVHTFKGRLINIHPSLLPKYPGLQTHERALEARDTTHGCSVHFLDTGLDSGPLIAQASVPVTASDTVNSLAERVLSKEHALYPWCVSALARGEITLHEQCVRYSERAIHEAREFGFVVFPV